jgi:2,5-furandicarboxylate decarboxylase 1
MSFREYLSQLDSRGALQKVRAPISKIYEIAALLKQLEPQPLLFEHVVESPFRVAGNLFCGKTAFADYFGITRAEIIPFMTRAIAERSPCRVVENAPCQEVVVDNPNLDALPILRHCEKDGGSYISSGVVIASHPAYGQNADFHRCMQFSKREMAMRIVRSRHFDTFLHDQKRLEIAVCVGLPLSVLAAAATSVEIGVDELEIANAMEPLALTRARSVNLLVPAESEFVIEGTVYLDRLHAEGPFVDLTETYDVVRQEPVFEVRTITHRSDAIWQALLPGAQEHKLLMGMPREPTIFRKVSEVARCLDVNVNPGGCSWLHAIVQIDKRSEQDGMKALLAAFEGHRSCKHVFVVDADIDIYDPLAVEWAMATRFQGDKSLLVLEKAPGSSLDPSAEPGSHLTTRVGFDLTKPLDVHGKDFDKAAFPQVDLKCFLEEWGD